MIMILQKAVEKLKLGKQFGKNVSVKSSVKWQNVKNSFLIKVLASIFCQTALLYYGNASI